MTTAARRSALVLAVATIVVVLAGSPASAHVGGPTHGLADGALHPLLGPDHLLAMVAVGVVAMLVTARRARLLPVAFLAGMAIGGSLGLVGGALPSVELAIVTSVVLLGLAVAFAPRLDVVGVFALVTAAGFVHGNAHGAEAPTATNPLLYVAGFLAVTAALHLLGVGVGIAARRVSPARVALAAALTVTGVLLLV